MDAKTIKICSWNSVGDTRVKSRQECVPFDMKITRIQIAGFKSLVGLTLNDPGQFLAFAGPNAGGKSNLFEALGFLDYSLRFCEQRPDFYPDLPAVFNMNADLKRISITLKIDDTAERNVLCEHTSAGNINIVTEGTPLNHFLLLKIGEKIADLSNMLRSISANNDKWVNMIEWLQIMVPGFKSIVLPPKEEENTPFGILEKGMQQLLPVTSVSNGTYQLLTMLAQLYICNEPQFLCIEHPESYVHPEAVRLLADLFRDCCDDFGHTIWVTTHSQTLVRCLEVEEIVLVNKAHGITNMKQFTKEDRVNMKLDEAWLSNALGGGVLSYR